MRQKFQTSLRRWIFQLSSSDHFLFRWYYHFLYRPAGGSLAWYIDQLSRHTRPFFLVQIGANDGMTHDPVHKFIKRDQWHALLLEPQTPVFETYLKRLYQRNPRVNLLNAALGSQDGEADLYGISFSSDRWATGLASFDRSVLEKAFTNGHIERRAKKEGIQIPHEPSQWISKIRVPVISVASLIHRYRISRIDLLQIDTEGYDSEVIRLFLAGPVKPRVISFEQMHLSGPDKKKCFQLLEEQGYTVRELGGNALAWWNEHIPSSIFNA